MRRKIQELKGAYCLALLAEDGWETRRIYTILAHLASVSKSQCRCQEADNVSSQRAYRVVKVSQL